MFDLRPFVMAGEDEASSVKRTMEQRTAAAVYVLPIR